MLLEELSERLDKARVEALCGEKQAHGNGHQRFQRAGTDTRTAVTTAGEHEFSLSYVEDTAAEEDEASYFRPIEEVLEFDGQNRYQQDIAAKSVDLATSLSYRDAADHGDSFVSMPSPTTINRRAKEYGSKLKQFLPECLAGEDADAVVADGTKCHSQEQDRSSHSVQATLGEDTADESRTLLDLSVNTDWDDTAAALDDVRDGDCAPCGNHPGSCKARRGSRKPLPQGTSGYAASESPEVVHSSMTPVVTVGFGRTVVRRRKRTDRGQERIGLLGSALTAYLTR
jgi:hypothetical protein